METGVWSYELLSTYPTVFQSEVHVIEQTCQRFEVKANLSKKLIGERLYILSNSHAALKALRTCNTIESKLV